MATIVLTGNQIVGKGGGEREGVWGGKGLNASHKQEYVGSMKVISHPFLSSADKALFHSLTHSIVSDPQINS